MEELASMRYKIINSMVKTFIEQEKKFFGTCFSLINNFFNNMHILEKNLPYQKSSYDPMKYTRASKIMEGVDANSLPEIKMKDKYSNNNGKSYNIQRANSCINNPSSNLGNYNNQIINKKFSFEDYKMRKASLDNSNKNNNNNINNYSNSIKECNTNNNDNQSNNPYSYEAYKKRTQSLGNNRRPQINNNMNNNNNNYYNNNLNIVMNSIIGDENTKAKNPFNDLNNIDNNRNNNYFSNNNNSANNPFIDNSNNKNSSNDNYNPYNNIFKSSSNNNNINNMFNSVFGNKGDNQQNNNDNKRFRKPQSPYNFGF